MQYLKETTEAFVPCVRTECSGVRIQFTYFWVLFFCKIVTDYARSFSLILQVFTLFCIS